MSQALSARRLRGSGLAKAKVNQDFLEVTGPGLGSLRVLGETLWCDAKLPREMADGGWRCRMKPGGKLLSRVRIVER